MKISFILQDLFQQGAQYVTALMIRGFVAKGYDVDLIVSKVHDDLLTKGDIKPFEIPVSAHIIVLDSRKARNNIRQIRHYLKTSDTRAVVAMSPNYSQALALASIGLRNRPELAYVEHSSGIGTGPIPNIFNPKYIINKFLASQYDVIMAVSSGTARAVERILRFPNEYVKVVYNPVIDDSYFNKLQVGSKHPWLQKKEIPTFVAAGAHCSFKNHYMLFQAIKLVNEQCRARLILFGKGELTLKYQEWIKLNNMDGVINLAYHTANLPAEIRASDGFIVSSDVESFSVVLVEALAAGVPVISTDCPFGPPELLAHGRYGTLVPINDAHAMANAILQQINAPLKAVPDEAWRPYTLENVVNTYEQALNLR